MDARPTLLGDAIEHASTRGEMSNGEPAWLRPRSAACAPQRCCVVGLPGATGVAGGCGGTFVKIEDVTPGAPGRAKWRGFDAAEGRESPLDKVSHTTQYGCP